MKIRIATLAMAAGMAGAQSVEGPVMGYVVDSAARLRPLNGMPGAGHVGAAIREGVRESWGDLALLNDGTALIAGKSLEGRWAALYPGAFSDASGQQLQVVAGENGSWPLSVPAKALSVRVAATGDRVATLLADDSLVVWSRGGKQEFSLSASAWWVFDFAGPDLIVYDPAANSLLSIDARGVSTTLRKLDGEASQMLLATDRAGRNAILMDAAAGRGWLIPLSGGDVKSFDLPRAAERLEAVWKGRAFLLTRDPARPLWLFDPEAAEPLLVIPAMSVEQGGQR